MEIYFLIVNVQFAQTKKTCNEIFTTKSNNERGSSDFAIRNKSGWESFIRCRINVLFDFNSKAERIIFNANNIWRSFATAPWASKKGFHSTTICGLRQLRNGIKLWKLWGLLASFLCRFVKTILCGVSTWQVTFYLKLILYLGGKSIKKKQNKILGTEDAAIHQQRFYKERDYHLKDNLVLEQHKYLQLIPFPYDLLPNLIFRLVTESFNETFSIAMAIDGFGIYLKCSYACLWTIIGSLSVRYFFSLAKAWLSSMRKERHEIHQRTARRQFHRKRWDMNEDMIWRHDDYDVINNTNVPHHAAIN